MMISENDKLLLLQMARQRIVEHLAPEPGKQVSGSGIPDSVRIRCGAFVSLYVKNELRGCIGTFSENEMLYVNVRKMALSAAVSDSRFSPIEASELKQLIIEISVLSPRKKISGPEEIVLGTHGIYIQDGAYRGTLLPQVALKQNWSVEQFLGNCSKYKAGLGWEGWKTAELYTYEAFVFSSEDFQTDC